jgi:hypothetical protein
MAERIIQKTTFGVKADQEDDSKDIIRKSCRSRKSGVC